MDDQTKNQQGDDQTQDDSATTDDILAEEEELLGSNEDNTIAEGDTSGGTSDSGGAAAKTGDSKFHIPVIVKEKYPKLIPLIIETESMNDDEREYWFQLLPIMTDDQVTKLKEILITEKKELAKLDEEYAETIKKISDKHVDEWEEWESKEKYQAIKQKEEKAEQEEEVTEEELLQKLQEL